MFFQQPGNTANLADDAATAFSPQGALCEWGCLSSWLDPAADDVNVRWTRELAELMRPFTTGSDYVNQIGLETDEGSERIKVAYGANCERTCSSQPQADPTNLFRRNQNIKPTVERATVGAAAAAKYVTISLLLAVGRPRLQPICHRRSSGDGSRPRKIPLNR